MAALAGYFLWAIAVVRASSTRGLELQNGCAALIAGVVLILPSDTFATAPGYRLFADWAPEPVWGLSFLGIGAAQVAATLHDVVPLRRIAAAICGVLFAILGFGILYANPISAVAWCPVLMAAGQLGAFVQARWRA